MKDANNLFVKIKGLYDPGTPGRVPKISACR